MEGLRALPSAHGSEAAGAELREHELLAEELGTGREHELLSEELGTGDLWSLPEAPQHCNLGRFCGERYRGDCHMLYLQQCRKLKRAQRQLADEAEKVTPLREAWNSQRLRMGDFVGEDQRLGDNAEHPNKWASAAVMTMAWRQVSGMKTMREGLDGMRRELSVLATVSSAAHKEQKTWAATKKQEIVDGRRSVAVFFFFDASPRRLCFGRLQDALMPHARYPYFENGKWITLKLQEYLAKVPGRTLLQHGVLDVLASSVECRSVDSEGLVHGMRILCRPQLLENSTASCLFSAVEESAEEFSSNGLRDLASKVPFVIVAQQPDACSSNTRVGCKRAADLEDVVNCFVHNGKCGSHQSHRIIVQTERRAVGDVHAIVVSCSHPQHAVKLSSQLREQLKELQVFKALPPAEYTARNRKIAKHTLLRRAYSTLFFIQ